jgi:DNA-binding CsgD family transcriptional regulator
LYAAQTVPEFVRSMMDAVDAQFNLLASGCEEVGVGASTYVVHGLRCAVPPPMDYAAYIHDNPLVTQPNEKTSVAVHHMQGRCSMAAWRRTDHFNGIARPMGFNDLIAIVTQASPTMVAISLYRDTGFTATECALFGLLQPHLRAAWKRVRGDDHSPTYAGPLRITLTPGLHPLHLSAPVRLALMSYFPSWPGGNILPTEVRQWADYSLAELKRQLPDRPLRALTAESARGRLLVRYFPEPAGGLIHLFMVETPAAPNFFRLQATGLTARECEVLHWVAQGKRDAEIAVLIGCASKTVSKHLERILAKTGTETRGGATTVAKEWLRPTGLGRSKKR